MKQLTREQIIKELVELETDHLSDLNALSELLIWGIKGYRDRTNKELKDQWKEVFDEDIKIIKMVAVEDN